LTDTKTTATMESHLDEIEAGTKTVKDILYEFNEELERDIFKANKSESRKAFETDHKCPSCNNGHIMLRKVSDKEVFLGCESWPECGYTYSISEEGTLIEKEVETGIPCPDCGNKLNKKNGKFGEFWSCAGYPACNWTGKLDSDGNPILKDGVQTTDQECPDCKKNMLVKRVGKFGDFLGCRGYPECTFTAQLDGEGKIVVKSGWKSKKKSDDKDTGQSCPKCKSNNLVEKNGRYGVFIACRGYPKCKFIKK
jgi:DNA topoisomerase I